MTTDYKKKPHKYFDKKLMIELGLDSNKMHTYSFIYNNIYNLSKVNTSISKYGYQKNMYIYLPTKIYHMLFNIYIPFNINNNEVYVVNSITKNQLYEAVKQLGFDKPVIYDSNNTQITSLRIDL